MKSRMLWWCIAAVLIIASNSGYCWTDLPSSVDPSEFEKQAKDYIVQRVNSGNGLRQLDHPELDQQFKNDTRDWESSLAQMIGDPKQYGIGASGVAFDAAVFRGTAKSPEIVEATTMLINAHVDAAKSRYDRYAERNQINHPGIVGELAGMMARVLQVGSQKHLLTILNYFNSEDELKINLINKYTPIEVASSLGSYGDVSHLEAARNFSQKLRKVGKNDVADDIDRSIVKIEKDAARKASENGDRGSSGSHSAKADAKEHSAEKENKLPWIVGAIVAGIVLLGGLILLRRKG